MPIKVTYTNQDINEYDLFEEIINCNLVSEINCSVLKANQLTSLAAFDTNINFPNLQVFNCANNQLTSLPDMNFPNLQQLNCSHNRLTSLPDNMNFPNLQYFGCCDNQ